MKIAIITGVSRGLGLALALAAAPRFDRIVGIGRTPLPGEPPPGFVSIEADLSLAGTDWEALLAAALEGAGEIVFFDNAAVHDLGLASEAGFSERLARAAAVNLVAPGAIASALLHRADVSGARLKLVHVSTGAAGRAIAGWGAYCASKAGAAMLFDVIAAERPDVAVSQIDPGALDTDMQAAIRQGPELPTRDYFRDLDRDGALVTPQAAAAKLLAALDG